VRRDPADARPGKTPAFHNIDIDEKGNTVGLF
jgi:hypothetical protein